MINTELVILASLAINLVSLSWIPGTLILFTLIALSLVFPKYATLKDFDPSRCIQIAIVIFILAPYAVVFVPGGGEYEQWWLDRVIAHLEEKRETCTDPEMQKMIDYTIRHYNYIGPFGVKVVQLPEDTLGINSPFCRGVTLDDSLPNYYSIPFGASVLVHEAMHDWFPNFGHTHIDDDRIMEAVK